MEPVAWSLICFRAHFRMFEFWDVRKWRCHRVGVENLRFVLRHGSPEELLRSVVPSPSASLRAGFSNRRKAGAASVVVASAKAKLGQPPCHCKSGFDS